MLGVTLLIKYFLNLILLIVVPTKYRLLSVYETAFINTEYVELMFLSCMTAEYYNMFYDDYIHSTVYETP
jgi:hypothetical protein